MSFSDVIPWNLSDLLKACLSLSSYKKNGIKCDIRMYDHICKNKSHYLSTFPLQSSCLRQSSQAVHAHQQTDGISGHLCYNIIDLPHRDLSSACGSLTCFWEWSFHVQGHLSDEICVWLMFRVDASCGRGHHCLPESMEKWVSCTQIGFSIQHLLDPTGQVSLWRS